MEGVRGPSYKTQLCDLLENYLGPEAVEPIRGDTTIRNGKKRRITAGPRPQPMVADPKLQNALKALQDNPDPAAEKCSETEAAFASLLIRGCSHGPQTEFLYTLLPPLHKSALLDWTPLLKYLLAAYPSKNGKPQDDSKSAGAASKPGTPAASPKSPKGSEESLKRGPPERLTGGFMAQMRSGSPREAASPKEMPELPTPALPAFRPVLCRAAHVALDSAAPVKPLTCLALLRLALTWIDSATEFPSDGKGLEAEKESVERERNEGGVDEVVAESMRLVRRLTMDDTHLLPTYVLLDETLILGDSIPSDEPLLSFLYDIHKRRDRVVYYFTRTDCQIRSPTFATLRAPPFTLQGILGEPLKGAELAAAVPPHSREWERAMACLKQGLRNSVSAVWWRRVLVLSPQFQQGQVNPSAEFSAPMLTEALVLRTLELLRPYPDSPGEIVDCASWQEWCLFADLLFQIVRSGHVDFLSYLEQLSQQGGPKGPPRSPLLAWLFSQLVRLEAIIDIFKRGTPAEKQRTFELLVNFAETPASELSQAPHVAVLLDWAPSFLVSRLSMSHKAMNIDVPFPALAPAWQADLTKRIKEGESWWQAFEAGKVPQDFGALDDVTTGRLWFLSHSRSQEFTKVWFGMLRSQGTFELPGTAPGEAPLPVIREVKPMPVGFLTGIAIQSLSRLTNMIEELVAMGQPAVSVSMLETYVRVLLVSPQSLYRKLFESLLNKYKPGDPRMTGTMLTLLELLNYRLLPFYRYHNKLRALWGDLERILAALLTLPGQHRLYRLTENVSMSVIGNIHRDFTDIKRATKGAPTSETVNRLMVLNIAIVSKTRGLASPPDVEHIHTAVKHLLAHSTHAWSEKTLRHFPASLREMLKTREDVRGRAVLAEWQKHGKAIITTHSQLAKPAADPAAVSAYLKNAPREFRRWAATALWTNMEGRHDKPNLTNFARALRDFTPEEITGNVYVLVDFILHSCTRGVTKGEPEATVLARTAANLAHLLWVEELLPYDVTLLALADRDDHPQALSLLTLLLERPEISQRVQRYCAQRGPAEHWTREEVPVRADLRAALGAHYAGSDRHPPLFDDLCLRALPVLPVLVGRLVEHDRFDAATKLLTSYGPLLTYHPSKLMVVRDLLAYYHGIMPPKLVNTLVTLLDVQKYGFSEPFSNYLKHPENAEPLLAPNYFLNLLTKVAHVLPSMGETLYSRQSLNPAKSGPHPRRGGSSGGSSTPWRLTSVFAKHQDCATQAQVLMATVEVELLAIPFPAERTARALVGAALWPENVGRMERNNRTAMAPRNAPGGSSQSPLYRPGITPSAAQFAETTGIVLAQLPVRFHVAFFEEVQSVISAAPWFNGTLSGLAEPGGGGTLGRLEEPGVKHRLQGWPFAAEANNAAEEGTVTGTTQVLGMAHAFGYAVPFEWLGSLSSLVIRQRPIRSGAHLRLCFKMVGPMVPAMAPSRPLFAKTLALLFTILADVFGRSSATTAADAAEMSDVVDFLHHCVTLEGRYMSPGDRSAHMSTLRMCTQAIDRLHPELQKLFRHLVQDPESALFAAEIAQKNQPER